MRAVVLGVRFFLEIGMLIALSNWGFQAEDEVVALILGIGAPALAAAVWGVFVAPKARVHLPDATRQLVALAIFGLGAVGLAASGFPDLALIFALIAVVDSVLVYMWRL